MDIQMGQVLKPGTVDGVGIFGGLFKMHFVASANSKQIQLDVLKTTIIHSDLYGLDGVFRTFVTNMVLNSKQHNTIVIIK